MGNFTLPLSQGLFATVSPEDYEWAAQWKWCLIKPRGVPYASRNIYIGAWPGRPGYYKYTCRYLHRDIMQRILGEPLGRRRVDHRNRDSLDCTRTNLRISTQSQNIANSYRRAAKSHTSRFKGVFLRRYPVTQNCWRARLGVNGKTMNLGSFPSEELAAQRYDEAATAQFGEFAALNFC